MPFNNKYEGAGVGRRLKEESVRTQKKDAVSVFINDTETWLSMGRDVIEDDETDFHAFWKGEGQVGRIRKAQGIITL